MVEFRKLKLILMHLTGGQPARNLEILSIRHSSSGEGEGKNIFVEDGAVVFMTRYHKKYILNKNIKIIYRYVSREVEELIVYYL